MTAPLLAFYGDDFTGSSAVMEVLTFAGIPTVMFLDPPGPEELALFPDIAAMGIAGIARSRPPDWMDQNLPEVFRALTRFGAPVTHYKVCSTFDSSPSLGSIGKAIDIGAPMLGGAWHPLVVGAPEIRRYQAFGTLFAGTDDGVYRLDRHPVMRRHPTTPMEEADLRLHLAKQTDRKIGLIDLATIKSGRASEALADCVENGAEILAIDVIDDETLVAAGQLIWNDGRAPVFAIGSQGVEYALIALWRASGRLPREFSPPKLAAVEQIFCVSGSCSPINAIQIDAAEARGFAIIELDAARAIDPEDWLQLLSLTRERALAALSDGRDALVVTARGPDDPALERVASAVERSGMAPGDLNDQIGLGLGWLVADIRTTTKLPRMVVAGGDTSGHVTTSLGALALSALAPLAPGAPLCRIHAHNPAIDGMEISLKGGQMGPRDFFLQAKGDAA
ncbi:MAG: four-carbon acid sugar kinase family protein [Hoeflea sp.]|uniref:four-carbon acid sugar kinase family protein n=1 Tax=Hoeflea sp. TaxID=1940281 RepID=UPI0032EDCBD8